ncbi:TPA: hypothetical protein EYP66_12420 [Candidatus Poribacteria bacterium]|nr:hypothetical protein [Candidatus Poribacteria bacterium]
MIMLWMTFWSPKFHIKEYFPLFIPEDCSTEASLIRQDKTEDLFQYFKTTIHRVKLIILYKLQLS